MVLMALPQRTRRVFRCGSYGSNESALRARKQSAYTKLAKQTQQPDDLPMPGGLSRRSQMQEDIHFRVLRLLQANPDITQRALAQSLGVSVGGLNYCLKAFMEKGWVKMQNFSASNNKLGYAYILTPAGLTEKARLTGRFLQRKQAEYEALRKEIDALSREVVDLNLISGKPAESVVRVPCE